MSNPALLANVADWQISRWLVSYAVNALWQAPMVAAAAWAVSRMMRRAGPRAEHIVWVGALLVMVALPAVPRQHWPHHELATVTMGTDDFDLSALPAMAPVQQPWWVPQIGLATLPRGLVMALLLGYFGAGLYFALRLGWSLWRTGMLVREAEEAEFAPEAEVVWERCRDAFALGEVRRLVSGEIACPVTVGRATVLVPAGFVESAAAEELLTAMAHECAHLRRRDFWKNVAYELATLPVAFHPMLWMVKRQIAETREMVCDGAAVERVVAPQSYVRSLLRLAEGVVGPAMGLAAMGMFDGRTLERRIVSMKMRRTKMSLAKRVMVLSAAVAAGVVVIAGGSLLAVAVEAKAAPIASQQVSNAASQQVSESASQLASDGVVSVRNTQPLKERATPSGSADDPVVVNSIPRSSMTVEEQQAQQEELKQEIQQLLEQQQRVTKQVDAIRPSVEELNAKAKELMQRQQAMPRLTVEQQLLVERVNKLAKKMQQQRDMKLSETDKLKLDALTKQMQQNALLYKQNALLNKLNETGYQAKLDAIRSSLQQQQRVLAQNKMLQPLFKNGISPSGLSVSAAAQGDDAPQRISGGVAAGSKLSGDQPVYPPIARAAHVQGVVVLHALISKAGDVQDVAAISGPQMLQNAAINAVRTWKYKPYILNDKPTAVETTITVNFAMDEGKPQAGSDSAAARQAMIAMISSSPAPASVAPQRANGPQRISGGIIARMKISGNEPVYPPIARDSHVQGAVVLHVILSKTGTVEDINVISGPVMLQNAAMDAVRTWRYKPFLIGDQPREVDTTVTVNFTMNGEPETPPQGASNGGPLFRIGGEVSAPSVLHSVEPEFSEEARKAGKENKFESATVLVYLVVDAQGHPQNVRVIKPVGLGLDEQAVKSVQQYLFRPAMKQGQPVPVELSIEVDFKRF